MNKSSFRIHSASRQALLPLGAASSAPQVSCRLRAEACSTATPAARFSKIRRYIKSLHNKYYFSAVALLPYIGDKLYKQPPMESITSENEIKWVNMISKYNPVDYKKFNEDDDNTELIQTISCGGGKCEIG